MQSRLTGTGGNCADALLPGHRSSGDLSVHILRGILHSDTAHQLSPVLLWWIA